MNAMSLRAALCVLRQACTVCADPCLKLVEARTTTVTAAFGPQVREGKGKGGRGVVWDVGDVGRGCQMQGCGGGPHAGWGVMMSRVAACPDLHRLPYVCEPLRLRHVKIQVGGGLPPPWPHPLPQPLCCRIHSTAASAYPATPAPPAPHDVLPPTLTTATTLLPERV